MISTDDEGLKTKSSMDQQMTEKYCLSCLEPSVPRELARQDHIRFITKCIVKGLPESYQSLDASQPWMLYWSFNALSLLAPDFDPSAIDSSIKSRAVASLNRCKSLNGLGYAGGHLQTPHAAPTYAAIRALVAIGTDEALQSINPKGIGTFFLHLKNVQDGSFVTHEDGETDMRGVYCAISTAQLCGVLTPQLCEKTASWIAKCQTYEGGIGGYPGSEAHGGYTFCAVATLAILNSINAIDTGKLLDWIVKRQMIIEGGFNGRSNKLVDSCYTFWQGASFAILARHLGIDGSKVVNLKAIQEYVLCCAQDERGGLRDKPGKSRDLYHTCYALSGLSALQHLAGLTNDTEIENAVLGGKMNLLEEIDPIHGIRKDKVQRAISFFSHK